MNKSSSSNPPTVETVRMPELPRLSHPRRNARAWAPEIDSRAAVARLRSCWQLVAKEWKTSDSLRHPVFGPLLRWAIRMLESDDPLPPVSTLGEERLLPVILGHERTLDGAVVVRWVSGAGLAFAVEALAVSPNIRVKHDGRTERSLELKTYDFYSRFDLDWQRLRQLLSVAPAAEWEVARETASRLRSNASLYQRMGLDYLFPDVSGWCAADHAECRPLRNMTTWPLLYSAQDGALLQSLAEEFDSSSDGLGSFDTTLLLVDAAGFDAVPALLILFGKTRTAEQLKACIEALLLVPVEATAAAFAERLEVWEVLAALQQMAASSPRLVLPALAARVARNRSSPAAEVLLGRLVRQSPAVVEELLPVLPEASRRAVHAARDRSASTVPEATREELPPVLARPPWKSKAARRETRALSLPLLTDPATMVWPKGLRESWLDFVSYRDPRELIRLGHDGAAFSLANLAPPTPESVPDLGSLRRYVESQAPAIWNPGGEAMLIASEGLALALWEFVPLSAWWFPEGTLECFVATYELRALPGLLRHAELSFSMVADTILPFRASGLALPVADALARLKAVRPAAQRWLLAHAEAAALGLIPAAVGPAGKARNQSGAALRFLRANGREEEVMAAAARYAEKNGDEAREAIHAVLDFDPLQLYPARLPKMPDFWQPAFFTRPLLAGRQAALPLEAVESLGTMLAISRPDEPYAGIALVKQACDPASLARFAWDLFSAWLTAGAANKEIWAFQALGLLGDDESARRLTPLIRQWPGEAAHARAAAGLDVLRILGTDVALMHLNGISQKIKFKALQDKAQEKLTEIAERRGLSAEELADRLVPELGLETDGSLVLDFGGSGSRAFRVGFDELLRPFVRDAAGKRLADLPKPGKGDDAEKAPAAQETWKALKKDLKTLAAQQVLRLELAMCGRRRWTPDAFRPLLAEHPLLQHLVRRLIWGVYDIRDGEEHLTATFRLSEDGTFADVRDDTWELPAEARIGIVHRFDLTDDVSDKSAAAWGQVLGDYEILQPFQQLGRDVYRATKEERGALSLDRVKGLVVPMGKILGLAAKGWRRGPA